jgi:hypothetical protein
MDKKKGIEIKAPTGPTLEEIKQGVADVRVDTNWITGEYLSAACRMVARQYIDGNIMYVKGEESKFAENAAYLLRQHAPIAYAYFFQNYTGDNPIPQGTMDIIVGYIRQENPEFLGGRKPSGIIVPEGFRSK